MAKTKQSASQKRNTQKTVKELERLFVQLENVQVVKGARVGSDLSVIIDKIMAKLKELDISKLGGEGLHFVIHLLIDTLLPKLKDIAPIWGDIIIDHIVIPLLHKLDEQYHPTV